jgi:hypothetical protein
VGGLRVSRAPLQSLSQSTQARQTGQTGLTTFALLS